MIFTRFSRDLVVTGFLFYAQVNLCVGKYYQKFCDSMKGVLYISREILRIDPFPVDIKYFDKGELWWILMRASFCFCIIKVRNEEHVISHMIKKYSPFTPLISFFFFTLILHINFNSHPISSRERKLEKEESFSKKGGKKGTTAIKSRPRLKTILLPSRVKPRATAGFIDFLPNSTCTAQETVSEIQATSPLLPIFSYRNRKFPVLVSHWPRAELLQIGRETKVGTGRGDKRVAQVEEGGEGN